MSSLRLSIDGEWYDVDKWANSHPGGKNMYAKRSTRGKMRPGKKKSRWSIII